jgi:chorismate mutase
MSTLSSDPHGTVRALRGATTVESDRAETIETATAELLQALMDRNDIDANDVISMIFTATPDLSAAFPAAAARQLGLAEVPLLCSVEIAVPGAMPRCIRVLVHFWTTRPAADLRHVYLGRARDLRADLDV